MKGYKFEVGQELLIAGSVSAADEVRVVKISPSKKWIKVLSIQSEVYYAWWLLAENVEVIELLNPPEEEMPF